MKKVKGIYFGLQIPLARNADDRQIVVFVAANRTDKHARPFARRGASGLPGTLPPAASPVAFAPQFQPVRVYNNSACFAIDRARIYNTGLPPSGSNFAVK